MGAYKRKYINGGMELEAAGGGMACRCPGCDKRIMFIHTEQNLKYKRKSPEIL